MLKKIAFLFTACFVCGVCAGLAQTKPKVVDGHVTGELATYALLISSGDFGKDAVLRLADDYLNRCKNIRLLRVGIYSEESTARDSVGKGVTDVTYGWWSREFETRKQRKLSGVAELLKNGVGATLRVRYADGRIEEIKISGENSFHPKVNGTPLSLAHMSVARKGFGGNKQLIPVFYFIVPQGVTLQEARKLAQSLFRVLPISKMEIVIREDEWFIFDANYPWLNPFSSAQGPPSEAVLAQSPEFLCEPGEGQGCHQVSVGAR